MSQRDFGGTLFAALLLAACGAAAIPAEKLTSAKASIRGAHEVGAEQNPKASLHLKMARDQVARAERLIAEDENEEAALALNQAQAELEALFKVQNSSTQGTTIPATFLRVEVSC